MDRHAVSSDGARVHYQISGSGSTALVMVHGWLGNAGWWSAQRAFFDDRYTVVAIDLPGHGASDRTRTAWSAQQYADDIRAVVDQLDAPRVVLVGHSMSGAYVVLASTIIPRTTAIVLVDTLKDLDQLFSPEQAQQMFQLYRADFRSAVENVLPRFLFAPGTPAPVRERLQAEFLATDPELAVRLLAPLYEVDLRAIARQVTVPVRAIQSDYTPTSKDNNRKYFRDFDQVAIADTGHYPMLERPGEFTRLLDGVLQQLALP
ncbi:MAG: alpha/beta hydrolase [Deltaproteobacteria bacterium]|nr:alpha/beta hydrolase [Deltaproteobacteria bacterium]